MTPPIRLRRTVRRTTVTVEEWHLDPEVFDRNAVAHQVATEPEQFDEDVCHRGVRVLVAQQPDTGDQQVTLDLLAEGDNL